MLSNETKYSMMRHLFYISYECNLQYKMSRTYKSAIYFILQRKIFVYIVDAYLLIFTRIIIYAIVSNLVDF